MDAFYELSADCACDSFLRFWRYINLLVCMHMYVCMFISHVVNSTEFTNSAVSHGVQLWLSDLSHGDYGTLIRSCLCERS